MKLNFINLAAFDFQNFLNIRRIVLSNFVKVEFLSILSLDNMLIHIYMIILVLREIDTYICCTFTRAKTRAYTIHVRNSEYLCALLHVHTSV